MAGQSRTQEMPDGCKQRCINTPGCVYWNYFPNGGCAITTGAEGISTVAGNPTKLSGGKNCVIDVLSCDTSGIWYLPLDMAGQRRTVETPDGCKQRCNNTPGCVYWNNFPNGGCHITTGAEGISRKHISANPTKMSGHKNCVID